MRFYSGHTSGYGRHSIRIFISGNPLLQIISKFATVVTMSEKTLLLDGFNLAFRAYYAMPGLTREDGFPTGALHGWVKTLWKLEDMENPARMAVFFDEGGSQRHQDIHADYKANRTEMPEDMQRQMPVLRELAEAMGLPVIADSGIEADDLIASAARVEADSDREVLIVSADKDFGQCVGGRTCQLLPAPTANPRLGWRKLDAAGVEAKFGVLPEQVPDYLALVGDVSDNIPGLAGVGPKTAVKWIRQYGNLERILEMAGEIQPRRFQIPMIENRGRLRDNLKMVTLERHHVVGDLNRVRVDAAKLPDLLERYGMRQSRIEAEKRLAASL